MAIYILLSTEDSTGVKRIVNTQLNITVITLTKGKNIPDLVVDDIYKTCNQR